MQYRHWLARGETERLRALIVRFDAAQSELEQALERRDFAAAGEALRRQREVLNEQHAVVLSRLHWRR
jgi:hypothetical protein